MIAVEDLQEQTLADSVNVGFMITKTRSRRALLRFHLVSLFSRAQEKEARATADNGKNSALLLRRVFSDTQ